MKTQNETKVDELLELINDYILADKKLKTILSFPQPIPPKPQKAYTLTEYKTYIELVNKNRMAVKNISSMQKDAETKFDSIKNRILDLPKNVWLLTDNKEYAIGIETSDWPMSPPKIFIHENPDIDKLSEIKHRISNFN